MYQYFMNSPIGQLRLVEDKGFIKEISLSDVPGARLNPDGKIIKSVETFTEAVTEKTQVLGEAERQLKEYFAGVRKDFDLPLSPEGTAFFQSVWNELKEIPYGETRTYGDIAKSIGKPNAARAIGMANHHNPIMIVIPCHRVIGANGKLVGYAGGLDVKERLLEMEGSHAD
ncbi:MAG: methylated-DNA--[protein]-cysteine S-methyltransferase [Clostridia bacterium]|nr:methylated-DNA--[protein]-cysteine S-methyltransferase [Lachnospiraceae bacterium]NCC00303.1 methylated-DNA--[protein]-cysteine S-methyltransferase [Clostridia bacterium]